MNAEELRGPGWQRLLAAARRRLERTGGDLSGAVGLTAPTDAERRVVIGLTGAYRAEGVRRLSVPLSALDDGLRRAHGLGLIQALERLSGPLRDRPGERAAEASGRSDLETVLAAGGHAGEPWYDDWASAIAADGTLTRLLRRGQEHAVAQSVRVLDLLPQDPAGVSIPLALLAEQATGDTKALIPGAVAASLVLRALAVRAGTEPPRDAVSVRELWERFGVVADDLASQVLVLNLGVARDGMIGNWLGDAAAAGIPFRLTLHQLSLMPLTVTSPVVYVCENPAVLRAAAAEGGPQSAALICTEGVPSAACRKLLVSAVDGGARLRVRADFDWAGLRITDSLLRHAAAEPWRMGAGDYLQALETGESTPLTGPSAASSWDPALAEALTASGQAVMEERLVPLLLKDLSAPSPE
ncbi:MAG: TIGR02679 family protein [Catenulispora sp.]|nr:TIGR02679 family protein [Catenulispora sp.]